MESLQSESGRLVGTVCGEKKPGPARDLIDPSVTATERFWSALEHMQKEAGLLQDCLDDLRRSTMDKRLARMCAVRMIDDEDLAVFSDELREKIVYGAQMRG